jgi:hypothetical protein
MQLRVLAACFCLLAFSVARASAQVPPVAPDLTAISIEELMSIDVTSASKREEPLFQVPAAIYVITQEELRHSFSIPEALRLVPGLDVAQIDANKWAVSARGFTGRFANKLLVLIDGRIVYTSTFSGVYWDTVNVVLEDVERIEGLPGAARRRPWARNPRGLPRQDLRTVSAGGFLRRAEAEWDGPRSRHFQAHHRTASRLDRRRKRGRAGQHVLVPSPAMEGRRRRGGEQGCHGDGTGCRRGVTPQPLFTPGRLRSDARGRRRGAGSRGPPPAVHRPRPA